MATSVVSDRVGRATVEIHVVDPDARLTDAQGVVHAVTFVPIQRSARRWLVCDPNVAVERSVGTGRITCGTCLLDIIIGTP